MIKSHSECVDIAETELRLALRFLSDEIADYPTPIAGCDEQFNHLLAQQRRVHGALDALHAEVFVPTPRKPTPQSGVESR